MGELGATAQPTIRVLVAEGEGSLGAALRDLIAAEDGLEVVGIAASAGEAIEAASQLTPDVAILGADLPGGGEHAAAEISTASGATRVLALSVHSDRTHVVGMLRAGAVGYVVKGGPPDELLEAIRRAHRGQASLSAGIVAALVLDLPGETPPRIGTTEVRRRDETRFSSLVESIPDGVVIVDPGGRIVHVNPQTEKLFGYSRDELLGHAVEQLLPERFRTLHTGQRDRYSAHPSSRPMGAGLQLTGRRRDGSEFPVDVSLSTVETGDGPRTISFVRDRAWSESGADLRRELAERRALLAHLVATGEEERKRIASDIHDDSIQVMTAAGMRLQLLRRALTDPDQLARLDELEQAIRLSISRLRHLIFDLRPPALDHEGLAAALGAYLEAAGEQTGITHRLDDRLTSEPSPATRLILYRIAQEVLTNVRKHARADCVTVTLSTRHGGCHLRIHDDGVGFTPDLDSVRPGHLGLPEVRERAELAGGWLRADSTPGSGTTIEFWIGERGREAGDELDASPAPAAPGGRGPADPASPAPASEGG